MLACGAGSAWGPSEDTTPWNGSSPKFSQDSDCALGIGLCYPVDQEQAQLGWGTRDPQSHVPAPQDCEPSWSPASPSLVQGH